MRSLNHVCITVLLALALVATACGGSDAETSTALADVADEPIATTVPPTTEPVAVVADEPRPTTVPPTTEPVAAVEAATTSVPAEEPTAPAASPSSCEATAAAFATKGSANPSLVDPEVSATCTDDMVTVLSNGIPDYTYIETSPGDPRPQDLVYVIPATPTATTDYTDVPLIGPVAVSINGIPIYGPTEGQGADVLSLGGGLSECGSHNGPGGFHLHLFSTSDTTDCIYTPAEVAAAPQLFGYAFDGYPIYTGNDQYSSSWDLTDESLFAVDTWAAHSYVAGSGDLDECNGRVDENGNYAYYTTNTFPYVIGCFAGEVDIQAPGGGDDGEAPGGAGGGGAGAPPGDDAEGAGPADGGGAANLADAAATLGVTVEELEAALGGRPPDFEAAAAALDITIEELEAALPAPPG